MPKIPQYTSKGNIGGTASAPQMSLGPGKEADNIAKENINAIAKAEELADNITNFRQKAEASALILEGTSNIKALADQDIDFDASKYDTQIDKLIADAGNTIKSPLAREEFMAQARNQGISAKWYIKNMFREKELKSADALMDYQGQQIIDNYGSMDEATRISTLKDYKARMENAVSIGLYSKGLAATKWDKFQKSVIKGTVDDAILNNPAEASAELQKGNEGKFPGLTQTERTNYINEANTAMEKMARQEKEAVVIATNKNESDLIDLKIKKTLTVPQVKEWRDAGKIRASFADSMIKALESPKTIGAKTLDKDFVAVMRDINKGIKSKDAIRDNMLKLVSEGDLNERDYASLNTYLDMITDKNVDGLIPLEQKTSWFGLHKFSEENTKEVDASMARMSRGFLNKLSSGIPAGQAALEAQREEVLHLRPEARNYPDGMKFIDSYGVVKIIMPNGDLLPVEPKSEGRKYMESKTGRR